MKIKFRYRFGAALLALLLLVALLASCNGGDNGGVLPSPVTSLPHPSEVTTPVTTTPVTTAPVTTAPVTTEALPPTAITPPEINPPSDDELYNMVTLVNLDKLSLIQEYYFYYYVGEFREVLECLPEIYDLLRTVDGVGEITDPEVATKLFVNAYAITLGDYYGYYYSPEDMENREDELAGEYVGIGVSVTVNAMGYAEILTVFSSSPAEDAGLLPGDLIVAVEGDDFAGIGYQAAIDRIRGVEGTTVTLTVLRDGQTMDVTMPRRRVVEETVIYRMMEGGIGYIRITSFDDETYNQFVEAHCALETAGATSYVFDVRNNPGGTLTSVLAILEYILPDGVIVRLDYKIDAMDKSYSSIYEYYPEYMLTRPDPEGHEITAPMVVLANDMTASAGELFTSALQDYDAATVVGLTTYGKGIGQTQVKFRDGSGFIFTIFYYAPPISPNFHGVGVVPDLHCTLPEEAENKNIYKLTYEEDTQLQAAVGLLTPQ